MERVLTDVKMTIHLIKSRRVRALGDRLVELDTRRHCGEDVAATRIKVGLVVSASKTASDSFAGLCLKVGQQGIGGQVVASRNLC